MSIDVSDEAVDAFNGGVVRNFEAFPSQAWVDAATSTIRTYGEHAAAQLVPGETVEWVTAGIVHRYGKVWPNAVLVVTPLRLILATSRGSLRAKHEVNALYRGPESLLGTARRLLPGSNKELWMLELASDSGPFVLAFPDFNRAGDLAELTAAFVSGRATYVPESGLLLLDGVPYSPGASVIATPVPEQVPELVPEQVPPAVDEPVTMAMPAAVADPAGTTTTQATPITIPQQYAPAAHYDAPERAAHPDPFLAPLDEVIAATPERVVPEPEPVLSAPAPADWYEDPVGEGRLRYWDGSSWSRSVVR